MAGIKQVLLDVLTRLSNIDVTNNDNNAAKLYTRLWNNQLASIPDASSYSFPLPAAFVEVQNDVQYQIIGTGVRSADLNIRIHLLHEFMNEDTTFEQDLIIFDLRDTILSTTVGLSQFCPSACGTLNCVREEQDFSHTNLYHYVLDFVCNFTDFNGSPLNPAEHNYIISALPNADLQPTYTIVK
jgi:hypothetical protein